MNDLLSKGSPNSSSETTEEVACDSNTHTKVSTNTRTASWLAVIGNSNQKQCSVMLMRDYVAIHMTLMPSNRMAWYTFKFIALYSKCIEWMIIICTPLSFSVAMFECVWMFFFFFFFLLVKFLSIWVSIFCVLVLSIWFQTHKNCSQIYVYTVFFRYSITKRVTFFALLLSCEHEYFPLIVLVRMKSSFALDLKTFHNNTKQYFADINKAIWKTKVILLRSSKNVTWRNQSNVENEFFLLRLRWFNSYIRAHWFFIRDPVWWCLILFILSKLICRKVFETNTISSWFRCY